MLSSLALDLSSVGSCRRRPCGKPKFRRMEKYRSVRNDVPGSCHSAARLVDGSTLGGRSHGIPGRRTLCSCGARHAHEAFGPRRFCEDGLRPWRHSSAIALCHDGHVSHDRQYGPGGHHGTRRGGFGAACQLPSIGCSPRRWSGARAPTGTAARLTRHRPISISPNSEDAP